MENKHIVKGGSFLIEKAEGLSIITPEDFTEEQKLIAKTAEDFVIGEVEPRLEELEEQKEGLMVELLRKAGELGLLAGDIPEEYGGMGLDKISSILITEKLARGASFALGHGAHTGIGSLPIVFFGTEEQKQKYLPGLASGEKLAAYALTEPGAGSDALASKTKAVKNADESGYVLNGAKQFITNAGFADVFTTYAKINGEQFTAFIIEKGTEGLTTGAEEKKMGIKGSSTRSLIFEDAEIPAENVLGEIGRGHVVAFNILNIGRYKLAAGCVGSAKLGLEAVLKYAGERKQFGKSLSEFGLIKQKIAEMNTRIFVAESMVYRTGGLIDEMLESIDLKSPDAGRLTAKGIEEYAMECSINKIYGSEMLDFVADEAVQIFGGYGYIKEYPVERMYRDARINRIFEGTNEINRLVIPATLLRKATKGELPLMAAAQKLMVELLSVSSEPSQRPLGLELAKLANAKKIFLMCAGTSVQKFGAALQNEQELLAAVSDLVIEIFAWESALVRTLKAIDNSGREENSTKIQMVQLYAHEVMQKFEMLARDILAAVEEGDLLKTQLSALKKLTRFAPENTVQLRRDIANAVLEAGRYLS